MGPPENGPARPIKAPTSIEFIQKKIMPSQLFIEKRDIIWPEEKPKSPEKEEELDEDGNPVKKKKKKKKKWVLKMYPKHEYRYPCVGMNQKKKEIYADLENPDQFNSNLSFFQRPNESKMTTLFHQNHEQRLEAR